MAWSWRLILLAALVVLVMGATAAWRSLAPDEAAPEPALSPPAPVPPAPVVSLPHANEAAGAPLLAPAALTAQAGGARAHWKQRVRLAGRVEGVERLDSGDQVVALEVGPGLPPLKVLVSAAAGGGAAPQAGHSLTLACFHHGMVMGEPVLADCQTVP